MLTSLLKNDRAEGKPVAVEVKPDGLGAAGPKAGGSQGTGPRGCAIMGTASLASINLDDAYLSGVLQELVDKSAGNVETVATNAVPVINKVSAGYPQGFHRLVLSAAGGGRLRRLPRRA